MSMHPLIQQFEGIVKQSDMSGNQIAAKAGVARECVNRWISGGRAKYKTAAGPSLFLFDCVLQALGYELRIVKRGECERG
jgi:DNA-binding phage protein